MFPLWFNTFFMYKQNRNNRTILVIIIHEFGLYHKILNLICIIPILPFDAPILAQIRITPQLQNAWSNLLKYVGVITEKYLLAFHLKISQEYKYTSCQNLFHWDILRGVSYEQWGSLPCFPILLSAGCSVCFHRR